MRARRPSGGPAFPFPPKPQPEPAAERSLSVVEPPQPARALAIRHTHEVNPDYEVRTREADLDNGGFVFYSETIGPNVNDKRLIEIRKKDGRWKASSVWQAEGTGEPPAMLNIFRSSPEIFNRAGNNLLYDMNFIVGKMFNMLERFGFNLGYDPNYPDDDEDAV